MTAGRRAGLVDASDWSESRGVFRCGSVAGVGVGGKWGLLLELRLQALADASGYLGPEAAQILEHCLGPTDQVEGAGEVALVLCQGSDQVAAKRFFYNGVYDCNSAALVFGGDKACTYGCLGLGTCAGEGAARSLLRSQDGTGEGLMRQSSNSPPQWRQIRACTKRKR